MNDYGSKYYYSRLTDGEKNIYKRISEALLRFEPALALHAGMGKAFAIDAKKLLTAVLFDNPVFFYVDRSQVIVKQTPMYIQLMFKYYYSRDKAEELWKRIEEKVNQFLADNIKPGMKPIAKQLEIHRYLRQNIKPALPPYDKDCFSVVGALVNNSCVCEGFAKAYKLFCDKAGIASIIVTGEAVRETGEREAHSWNITRISGVTAHTDVTWDAIAGTGAYDYFNLCDADIAADHSFDFTMYPKCEPNKINYFYINGFIASDEQELLRIISKNSDKDFFSVKLLFPIDQGKIFSLGFPPGELRYNKMQNIIAFKSN